MILQGGEFKRGIARQIGKEGSFERLRLGIEAVYPREDSEVRAALMAGFAEARRFTDEGEILAAGQCYVTMQKIIRHPKRIAEYLSVPWGEVTP